MGLRRRRGDAHPAKRRWLRTAARSGMPAPGRTAAAERCVRAVRRGPAMAVAGQRRSAPAGMGSRRGCAPVSVRLTMPSPCRKEE
eukprot:scaffold726_cov320-Prasinococcus_capsulatus_cf.AAC.2